METTKHRPMYRHVLALRLTADQHNEIATAAEQSGITVSSIIRNGALNEARRILHSGHQPPTGLTATYHPELSGILVTIDAPDQPSDRDAAVSR